MEWIPSHSARLHERVITSFVNFALWAGGLKSQMPFKMPFSYFFPIFSCLVGGPLGNQEISHGSWGNDQQEFAFGSLKCLGDRPKGPEDWFGFWKMMFVLEFCLSFGAISAYDISKTMGWTKRKCSNFGWFGCAPRFRNAPPCILHHSDDGISPWQPSSLDRLAGRKRGFGPILSSALGGAAHVWQALKMDWDYGQPIGLIYAVFLGHFLCRQY